MCQERDGGHPITCTIAGKVTSNNGNRTSQYDRPTSGWGFTMNITSAINLYGMQKYSYVLIWHGRYSSM